MSADLSVDVIIVGAGPAGLTAARTAAESGAAVLLVDAGPGPGGQIWRGLTPDRPGRAGALLRAVQALKIPHLRHADVSLASEVAAGGYDLMVSTPEGVRRLHAPKVILATGATERFLPFPGWTLPGVVGAGGLQAMTKSGLRVRGQRVVIAGSGPLLLAVAASLRSKGARVVAVAEQARWAALTRFGLQVGRLPGKRVEALTLAAQLRGVPYWPDTYPLRVNGAGRVETVTLQRGQRSVTLACDWLAVGFGLVPDTRLATALRCDVQRGAVVVDDCQRTSRPGLFAVGEVTGVGGVEKALQEGFIAGCVATDQLGRLDAVTARVASFHEFQVLLERTFTLRPELRGLPDPDTVVCRCEDVPFQALLDHASWTEAKLQTRCGMGTCQGRVCGPATETLLNWTPTGVRLPLTPLCLSDLLQAAEPRADPVPGACLTAPASVPVPFPQEEIA